MTAEATARWLAHCAEAAETLGAEEHASAATLREAGREAFAAAGLPTTGQEEWRYTNPSALRAVAWEPAAPTTPEVSRDAVEEVASPVFACGLLVFADGHLVPGLSTLRAPGVELTPLAEARRDGELGRLGSLVDTKRHPFAALATAMLDDGVAIRLPAGTRLEQPIHLVFLSTGAGTPRAAHPRVVVEAGRGSHAVVVQDHVSLGPGPAFTNAVSELHVGPGAELGFVTLQREGDATFHVSNTAAELERDARLHSHVVTLGGRFVRNDLAVRLSGEGAEATLGGLFLADHECLVDNHGLVDHAVPHGTSHQLYKGVLTDRGRGVFRGRVLVRPDAQHTDARQSNPNLLLSDGAEIDSKPQLEIHADDVKCSHGSAIGRVDEDALFYLQARGIDATEARTLLVRGFAAEVLRALPEPALSDALGDTFAERLGGTDS
ncbi:MAG: Fe-S cluster assembly protein SufD [Myxococcota bacterium]